MHKARKMNLSPKEPLDKHSCLFLIRIHFVPHLEQFLLFLEFLFSWPSSSRKTWEDSNIEEYIVGDITKKEDVLNALKVLTHRIFIPSSRSHPSSVLYRECTQSYTQPPPHMRHQHISCRKLTWREQISFLRPVRRLV